MKKNQARQYTIRNIPPALDRQLKECARREGKSLNEAVVETLCRGAGVAGQPIQHADLDDVIGTWVDDPQFDAAIAAQDQIDPHLWS